MMDLALELGMPLAALRHAITENELGRWSGYIRRRKLPQFRIEIYLAKLTMVLAECFGGAKNKTLADFIIDFDSTDAETADEDEFTMDEVYEAFGGFNPVNK